MPNNGTRPACRTRCSNIFGIDLPVVDWTKEEGIADEEVRERILKAVEERAAARTVEYGVEVMRYVEKAILLQTLDHHWREHIVDLDHLRQYVGLRGYGQRDPLNEYKGDAFELFQALLSKLRSEVVRQLMHVQIQTGPLPPLEQTPLPAMQATHIDPLTGENEVEQAGPLAGRCRPVDPNNPKTWDRVQRNAPCPCGSGRKYKHCHGAWLNAAGTGRRRRLAALGWPSLLRLGRNHTVTGLAYSHASRAALTLRRHRFRALLPRTGDRVLTEHQSGGRTVWVDLFNPDQRGDRQSLHRLWAGHSAARTAGGNRILQPAAV